MKELPLGQKAYLKIPHLPGSRTGSPGSSPNVVAPRGFDKSSPAPLARRCTHLCERGDLVVVQEKLDGSCVAVTVKAGEVIALGREGWRAALSQNPGRQMFARWVSTHAARFREVLQEGEWLVGEWLALAHSTRYQLKHEPLVVFDLFSAGAALSTARLEERLGPALRPAPPPPRRGRGVPGGDRCAAGRAGPPRRAGPRGGRHVARRARRPRARPRKVRAPR